MHISIYFYVCIGSVTTGFIVFDFTRVLFAIVVDRLPMFTMQGAFITPVSRLPQTEFAQERTWRNIYIYTPSTCTRSRTYKHANSYTACTVPHVRYVALLVHEWPWGTMAHQRQKDARRSTTAIEHYPIQTVHADAHRLQLIWHRNCGASCWQLTALPSDLCSY